jgi:hypothetical protein
VMIALQEPMLLLLGSLPVYSVNLDERLQSMVHWLALTVWLVQFKQRMVRQLATHVMQVSICPLQVSLIVWIVHQEDSPIQLQLSHVSHVTLDTIRIIEERLSVNIVTLGPSKGQEDKQHVSLVLLDSSPIPLLNCNVSLVRYPSSSILLAPQSVWNVQLDHLIQIQVVPLVRSVVLVPIPHPMHPLNASYVRRVPLKDPMDRRPALSAL